MPHERTTKTDLRGLNQGDPEAIERLWSSYFQRLVGLCAHHDAGLRPASCRRRGRGLEPRFTACARAPPPASSRIWAIATICGGSWW